jgi:hypothetical protein
MMARKQISKLDLGNHTTEALTDKINEIIVILNEEAKEQQNREDVENADDDGNAGNGKPTPEATGQTQETPPPKPVSKTGKATQDVVVDGVVVWSKSNDIRGEFNDLRQKETGCIDTSQWRDIETQIKNVLGGSKLAFAAWLKSVYGVEWYNIKLEMYDGIYATITKSPLEVMKFKPKAK